MKRLEAQGYILGFTARCSIPRNSTAAMFAFVEVRLTDTREAALAGLQRRRDRVPRDSPCHLIAGKFDYLLKIPRAATWRAYRDILVRSRLGASPCRLHLDPCSRLQAVKDAVL